MTNSNIFVDRTTTWHAIGKDVQECKNMEQVLLKSGLDYEVTKMPVFAGGIEIPNRFVTARPGEDGPHFYDVVSDKFQIVQNRHAFDFVNYMGDDLTFEKAGETANGIVYIISKLPEVDILGDTFTPHVIFRNGFSGKVKITAAICPLRVVCQNQFNFAFKNTQNAITIRHVGNAEDKLQDAREVLKLSADYMTEINAMANQYVGVKLTHGHLEKVVDHMFPTTNIESMNSFKRHQLEAARAAFINAYNADDNGNFRGTAWGLINAYTDYITHKVPMGNSETKEEGKFMAVTFHPAIMNAILNAMATAGVVA
jgi:phage/plasmid-like protein (TIGR03299 family)